MGLNRFILVFVASYPAVIFVNGAVRATLGPSVSDFLTVGMVTLTGLALCAAFCRYRPGRSDSVADVRAAVRLTSLAQPPAEVRNAGETLTAEGLDQRVPLDGDAGRLR
jgi:hypothetical protein